MKSIKKLTIPILILFLMFSSFFAGFTLRNVFAQNSKLSDFELFWEVIELVEKEFVEPVNNFTPLIYGAIRGMLQGLDDDYTRFMDPKAYKEMQIEAKGEFGGVGIQIGIKDKKLTVIAPLPDTPAEKAGLRAGDWIQKIDGRSTQDMSVEEAVTLIRGEKGTSVTLTILHQGEKKPVDYLLVRDIIKIRGVEKEIIDKDIGYVKIVMFNEKTSSELDKVLEDFESKKIKGLIIDLRYNPGGLLDSAVEVANKFISSGPIVQIVDKRKRIKTIDADKRISHPNVPTVVLVNEFSASASEIVAGALQDNKVATLVGVKTFGKGSVQTVHRLRDNSAVAITTAKYLTSAGRDINKKGIVPDIIVDEPKDEKKREELDEAQLAKAKEIVRRTIAK